MSARTEDLPDMTGPPSERTGHLGDMTGLPSERTGLRDRAARRRLWILGIEVAVFLVLAFLLAYAAYDEDRGRSDVERNLTMLRTTVGVLAGPFDGAIARIGHSDCLRFSLRLLPWCGAILACGVLAQLVPARSRLVATWILPAAWTLGWLGWFGGAILSLGFALE